MKTILILLAISLAPSAHAACDYRSSNAYDCAGKGEPHWYEDKPGHCTYYCLSEDGKKLSCEDIHPAPDTPEYKTTKCEGKVQAYDCARHGKPYFIGDCSFVCIKEDMLFTCDYIHAAREE